MGYEASAKVHPREIPVALLRQQLTEFSCGLTTVLLLLLRSRLNWLQMTCFATEAMEHQELLSFATSTRRRNDQKVQACCPFAGEIFLVDHLRDLLPIFRRVSSCRCARHASTVFRRSLGLHNHRCEKMGISAVTNSSMIETAAIAHN